LIFQLRNFGIDLGEVAASLGKVRAKEKEEGKKGEGKKKKNRVGRCVKNCFRQEHASEIGGMRYGGPIK